MSRLRAARGRQLALTASSVRRPEPITGEVVFNTVDDRLPGVDDRSLLRRPDHRLHLPADRQLRRLCGGDGVRPDPRPRGDHARPQEPRGRRQRRGRLARLARRLRRAARSAASTPAPWSATFATAARCGAGSSRPRCPRLEARERIAAEPSMDGADLARTVTPRGAGSLRRVRGPHVVGIDTGVKLNIVRQLRERDCRVTLLPCTSSAAEVLAEDPDLIFLANGPGDPAALDYIVETVRGADRQAAALRDLPRPPAALPGGRPGDLQASLRPPRRQSPGQGAGQRAGSTSPRKTTASRSRGPTASRGSRPTSRSAGRPTSAPPS